MIPENTPSVDTITVLSAPIIASAITIMARMMIMVMNTLAIDRCRAMLQLVSVINHFFSIGENPANLSHDNFPNDSLDFGAILIDHVSTYSIWPVSGLCTLFQS